jgi:hypothetical protein
MCTEKQKLTVALLNFAFMNELTQARGHRRAEEETLIDANIH